MEKNKQQLLVSLAAVIIITASMLLIYKQKFLKAKPISFDQEMRSQTAQSESTSLESIEKDVNKTQLDDVDKEINEIETELDSIYQ